MYFVSAGERSISCPAGQTKRVTRSVGRFGAGKRPRRRDYDDDDDDVSRLPPGGQQ